MSPLTKLSGDPASLNIPEQCSGLIWNAERLTKTHFSGQIYQDRSGRFPNGFPVNIAIAEDLGDDLYKTPSGYIYQINIIIDRTQKNIVGDISNG